MSSELYPRFSDEEFRRRWSRVRDAMRAANVSALIVFGVGRTAAEVQYLTNWIVQRQGVVVVPREGPLSLYVRYHNHVPHARQVSVVDHVECAGVDAIATVVRHVRDLADDYDRIGIAGPLSYLEYQALAEGLPETELIDMTAMLLEIRLIKSSQELEWLRRAAAISDHAVARLSEDARPGMTDHDLVGLIEQAHRAAGGSTQIAFLASTSMSDPHVIVPAQQPSNRRLAVGDVVIGEISGQYWGYSGQVLRTLTIGTKLDDTYQAMHDVALELFKRVCDVIKPGASSSDVIAAAAFVEDAGYGLCDDLVHGYGGGYLPPIIRALDVERGVSAPFVFKPNMVVVVQPNVVDAERRRGVQVGEMIRVATDGIERMHRAPMGPLLCSA